MRGRRTEAAASVEPHRLTVLFILGAGHSGSTLLNLLFNAHSEAIGLCEVHAIHRFLSFPDDDPRNPLHQKLWRDVATCWTGKTGIPFREIDIHTPRRRQLRAWGDDQVDAYVDHNMALLDCVARVSGARVIVDSSHNRWRLLVMSRSAAIDLRVVHVIRDGRAVVNSYSRKYQSLGVGLRRWLIPTALALAMRPLVDVPWVRVRYEDLASRPESVLEDLCEFAGLEFEPGMVRYWEHEDYSIGGNRMRRSKRPVKLDERWQSELSTGSRVAVGLLGGWLNWLCGYSPLARYRRRPTS